MALWLLLPQCSPASDAWAGPPGSRDYQPLVASAFYEKDGRLEVADTTLRFANGTFSMDAARYHARLAAGLDEPAPIAYQHGDVRLAFAPTGLTWSGSGHERLLGHGVRPVRGRLITGAWEVDGSDAAHLAGRGLIYEDAYGEGLHLGVLTTNLVFRKIVRFDRLASLGAIPEGAEVLEVGFELQTDEATTFKASFGGEEARLWDEAEAVVARGEPVEFAKAGQRSFIEPAHAWDSAGDRIPLDLQFRSEGGRLFLIKLIPVAWLKRAVFPVFADVDLTFGLTGAFNAASTSRMSVTPLDSTRVVIAYEDTANGSFGTAVVGTISGKTISFGPEWVFNPASTVVVRLSATTLDASHVVIAYWDVGNTKSAIVGTVAGNTITFGSEYVFQGAAAATGGLAAVALDSTHVAIAYQDPSNGNFGTAIVGTVSGGNVITFGATYVFRAGITNFPSAAALDSTHFVAAYRAGGAGTPGTALVGTVSSGDVISYGPASAFNPADTGAITPARLDGTHVLIAYGDLGNSGFGTAIVGTVSGGNNLSFGSEVVYNASVNNGYNVATSLDSNHVVIAFTGVSAASDGAAVVGTISGGNSICFGAKFVYDTVSILNPSARALDATRVLVAYDDATSLGTAIVAETSRLQRLIGFETVYAPDEIVSVSLDSGTQSIGVRPGSGDYFLEQAVGPSTLAQGLATCEGTSGVRFSFRKRANPAADQILLQFRDAASTNLWSLRLRTDGRLQVQQDQAIGLTTTAGATALLDNVWYTVRLVYDRAAGGVLKVWLNVPLEIDATHAAAGTSVDQITVSGPASPNQYHYDDFSITDSAGFQKFGQIVRREPVGAGNLTQFDTPTPPGAHYPNVAEVTPDLGTFNEHAASTVATDLYALADSPVGRINGVKAMWQMRRGSGPVTGGTHDYAWRENGVNRNVEFLGLSTSWTLKEVVWETPPNSGGNWNPPGTATSPKFDALELGACHNGTQSQDTDIGWAVAMVDFDDGSTTAVTLMSFDASGSDGAVDLSWQTGSELHNLGFHLYRSSSSSGPWARISSSLIPGLGSSPLGASYSWRDSGLVNGQRYFYRLEDVDTSSVSTFHGPVSAVPQAAEIPPGAGGGSGGSGPDDPGSGPDSGTGTSNCPAWVLAAHASSSTSPLTCKSYGDPSATSLRILSRTSRGAVVDLVTSGFVALREGSSSLRVFIPGFELPEDPSSPALPLRRALVDAVVGRGVRLASVEASSLLSFPGLVPSAVGSPEMAVLADGTVRPSFRPAALRPVTRGLIPAAQVRLAGIVFQGEDKRAVLQFSPLRFDPARSRLVLARRVRVRLSFVGEEPRETGIGRLGRQAPRHWPVPGEVLAQLYTSRPGLHAVAFSDLFPGRLRPLSLSALRLQRPGLAVPFHVEPSSSLFGPGSVLFFYTEASASSTDFSPETAFELVRASTGQRMGVVTAAPSGAPPAPSSTGSSSFETDRIYQPGLLDAPDPWLWEALWGGVSRTESFSLRGVDSSSAKPATLVVFLQGGSDAVGVVDHHVVFFVNGTPVGETRWDGKAGHRFETTLPASLLREGSNDLTVENAGDTGVYSLVFLDKFSLAFPRTPSAREGLFEGTWSETGTAEISGLGSHPVVLDLPPVTGEARWLTGFETTPSSVRFLAQAGHRYVVASAEALAHPRVAPPRRSTLKDAQNQADFIVIAPDALLPAVAPLLERRQSEGLASKGASLEEISSVFGHGQVGAQAIRDFLAFAFHSWARPSPRYVLLLGESTDDPRNFTTTAHPSPLPAFWTRTSYLLTVSDPALAAVNGEDSLPDLAIGRLPATTLEEAQRMVGKVLDWEDSAQSLSGRAVLVADDPDEGGDFEADVEEIAQGSLSARETRILKLRQLGAGTRDAILDSFDEGASLVSYVGHGGPAVWASENVLNSWDPPLLRAQDRQPLLITVNCLNGYFVAPNYDALSEAFLKAEGRGTIASFSPSGLSLDAPAHLYHRALVEEIASGGHRRLGDALLAAQRDYALTGALPELLSIYHLLGDPTLKIDGP